MRVTRTTGAHVTGAAQTRARRARGRARLWAIVALAASAALVALVIAFLVRNGAYLVIGIVGLAFAIAGGWWSVIERMPRRLLGNAAVLVGVALQILAVLAVGQEDWTSVVRFILALLLLAIAGLAA